MSRRSQAEEVLEIALIGDLSDCEADVTQKLLEVPPGGECSLYFDCPGGSPYSGLSVTSLILMRGLRVTGIVTGECSSAALWPFAACCRRIVTPFSVLLFHPMKWQSEEHVGLLEAAEWARHFGRLEEDMDQLLADLLGMSREKIDPWMRPGKYVGGPEFAAEGMAELVTLGALPDIARNGAARRGKQRS
jgi:ATP-dependent protease ClpP protease subunit